MADHNPNFKDVLDTLRFLHEPGAVFELCLIKPAQDKSPHWEGRAFGKKPTVAGWFKDQEKAAGLASQVQAEGIYVTLNPCVPAMLSKANERLKVCGEGDRTSDTAIAGYRNLLIDIDPHLETGPRPTGVSSSEIEHGRALGLAQKIKMELAQEGWPEPLYGDSGNGAHLDYPLELDNNEDNKNLLKRVLAGLSACYAGDLAAAHCELDQKVFNAARLTKLYGTMVRKGDDTPDRPHRLAQIISLPQARRPVPLELLQKLAATVQSHGTQVKAKEAETKEGRFDVEAYLKHYGVEVVKLKPHRGGMLYCLQECLFDSSHNGNEAAIGQAQDGKLFYQCFHNSCKHTWAEARTVISGSDKLNEFIVGGGSRTGPAPPVPAPDYDSLERVAIQSEARHASINSSFLYKELSPRVEKALKDAGLTGGEIIHVINSIRKSDRSIPLAQRVRDWVLVTSGYFFVTDCYADLNLVTGSDKNTARQALLRMEKEGTLEKCGDRRGCYRLVDATAEELKWWEADTSNIVPLELPFELHKQITIFHKTVIIVAGVTDSGKTAYLLNTALLNHFCPARPELRLTA